MAQMLSREEAEALIDEKLKSYYSDNMVDGGRVDREALEYLVHNKVDARSIVDYEFAGTSAESFEHNLGRTPKGYIILNQSQAAVISGIISSWTSKKITLTSSVGSNRVRFLFL
jgi:hypothetical protein